MKKWYTAPRFLFGLVILLNGVRKSNIKMQRMAIYIKCPLCGEEYNELTENKCPHCGCAKPVTEENAKNGTTSEENANPSPFPLEIPMLFSGIYNAFYTDHELSAKRLFVTAVVETIVGVVIALLGYAFALFTDTERGPALIMWAGVIVIMHAFYSLTKHGVLLILEKKQIQKPEKWMRYVLFITEVVLSVFFITVAVLLDDIVEHSGSNSWIAWLLFIGAGLAIGAIWSLIKYYRSR